MIADKRVRESLPVDKTLTPRGDVIDKVEVYGWDDLDKPGTFQKIDKTRIGVDHTYQRDNVNEARVNRIAHHFSWRDFGTLSVVKSERDGKSFWCFDGQHRLRAALKRSDVAQVPCMIYPARSRVEEAEAFLACNGERGAVKTMDKFKALLTQGDPVATAIKVTVGASGYEVAMSNAKNVVRCIGALYRAFDQNAAAAAVAWRLCVELYRGEAPIDRVFAGLWALENVMRKRTPPRSLLDVDNHKTILKVGAAKLNESVGATAAYLNRSGQKVFGAGVAAAINKGRKPANYVPSLLPGTEDE